MALEWKPALSVGNEEIDNQHRELFVRVNKLIEAMNQRKGREEVANTLEFLENYVVEHFGTEERYMDRIRYPNSEAHKKEHQEFRDKFSGIKKEYEAKGHGSVAAIMINSQLGAWLLRHIPTVDKDLAKFMRKG